MDTIVPTMDGAKSSYPKELGTQFTYAQAQRCGMTKHRFYTLRDQGALIPIGGGLYRLADAEPANLDLIEIAERTPQATLCLHSALAEHELTDLIPDKIHIALPRGTRKPKLTAPVKVHHFHPPTFALGQEEKDVNANNPILIYSAERTILDMIRLNHIYGSEYAWEALRRWLKRRGSSPSILIHQASYFRGTQKKLLGALEVLL